MKYFLSLLGVGTAAVLLFVSAAMNWRFGFSLGKTELDSQIYGAASAAADGMKALLPFFILWAFRQKSYGQVLAGSMLWIVCAAYSLTSSLGFAALNRAEVVGERTVQATVYNDLRGELEREQEKLGWVPQHRSIGEVEADLTAVLAKPVIHRRRTKGTLAGVTKDCTVTNWRTQKQCGKVLNLRKELAVSRQARKLEDRISDLKKQVAIFSATAASGAVAGKSDPQAALLAKLSGFNTSQVQIGLIILVSMLVELGSGLGLFVAFSHMTVPDKYAPENDIRSLRVVNAKPKRRMLMYKSDVERFYSSNVEHAEGDSVTTTEMHADYKIWCEKKGREPLPVTVFGRQLSELGIRKTRIGGRMRYIDVQLKSQLTTATPDQEDKPDTANSSKNDNAEVLEGVKKIESAREGSQDAKYAVR